MRWRRRERSARPARPTRLTFETRSGAGAATGGAMLGLFAPGYQHTAEQRRVEALPLQDHEAGAPPLGVDLERGTATIRLPAVPEGAPRAPLDRAPQASGDAA